MLRQAFVAERLPFMLWAVYGFIDQFDIEYSHLGKTQRLLIDNQQSWQVAAKEDNANTDLTYRRLNDDTGYLDVTSFDVDPDAFSDQLTTAFSQIAKDNISALVIDIRHNTGGNTDTATELASYIANKPFRLVSQMTEKLNADNRGLFGYKGGIGEIISTEWDDYVKPNASANHFKGKVIVLIGPVSYSAAIVFATTVQDNQFGILAGKATGGFANQSAQGNLFNLPHSQLRAYVATRLLVRPSGNTSVSAVIPDLPVADKLQDQQNAIDTALQQVLEHLSKVDNHAKLQ